MSELIHKSDEHQDYTFAKVDVHFKDVLDVVRPLGGKTLPLQPGNVLSDCTSRAAARRKASRPRLWPTQTLSYLA